MKTITIILFLAFSSLNAQFGKSFEPATLTLRNAEVIEGEAKLLSGGKIRFRKEQKGEKINYTYKEVEKIEIKQGGVNVLYVYKVVANRGVRLMKLLKEYPDKINLYGIEQSKTIGANPADGINTVGMSNNYMEYYTDKGKGGAVTKLTTDEIGLGGHKKFRKTALKFFEDCPSLIKKIKDKEFGRRKNVLEIVEYYANECD